MKYSDSMWRYITCMKNNTAFIITSTHKCSFPSHSLRVGVNPEQVCHRDKHSFIPASQCGNVFSVCGRKLGHPEKTHKCTGRTCRLHSELYTQSSSKIPCIINLIPAFLQISTPTKYPDNQYRYSIQYVSLHFKCKVCKCNVFKTFIKVERESLNV